MVRVILSDVTDNTQQPQILFISLSNIGDVVLTSTLLERVLADHPNAVVDIVVGPRAAELFEGLPNLRHLIPLHKKKAHMHYVEVVQQLKKYNYDYIFDLRTPFLTRFLKGQKKVRFARDDSMHKAYQYARMWPTDRPVAQKVWINPEVQARIDKQLADYRYIIGLAPTANWLGKQWPQKNYAELLSHLIEQPGWENVTFAVFGAENERKRIDDLLQTGGCRERMVDLVGKTGIGEAYAWLSHCKLFIGNDSGLAHMAAAAHVPTVTIFGPMPDHLYAPFNPYGTVVKPDERKFHEVNLAKEALPRLICDISPQQVKTAMDDLFRKINEKEPAHDA